MPTTLVNQLPAALREMSQDTWFGCIVAESELFRSMPRNALSAVKLCSRTVHYPAGARLFSEGRTAKRFFIVRVGKVRVSATLSGRNVTIRMSGPGTVLGLSSAIGNQPYVASAETVTPCEIDCVPESQVRKFLGATTAISNRMIAYMAKEAQKAWDVVKVLSSTSAKLPRIAIIQRSKGGARTR